jgi:hypothetical protein
MAGPDTPDGTSRERQARLNASACARVVGGMSGVKKMLLVGVAAVTVVSVAVGAVVAVRWLTAESVSWQPSTVVEAINARLAETNGVLTKDIALDAYATMLGPIPGGTPIAARQAGTLSGSLAIRGVLARWDEMDEAQREVIQARLLAPLQAASDVPQALDDEIHRIAADMTRRYGITYPPTIRVVRGKPTETAAMGAAASNEDGEVLEPWEEAAVCIVFVNDKGMDIYERVARGEAPHRLTELIAHELVHCYQFKVGRVAAADRAAWLIEGSAAWGGALYAQQSHNLSADGVDFIDFVYIETWWRLYLDRPKAALTARSYDGIGFHSMIAARVGDASMWRLLAQMLTISLHDGSAAEVAFRATGVDRREVMFGLATGVPRDRVFGPPLTGPGLGRYAPRPREAAVGRNDSDFANVDTEPHASVAHRLVYLDPLVDLIYVNASGTGLYLLRPAGIRRDDPVTVLKTVRLELTQSGAWYCVRDSCKCDNDKEMPAGMQTVPDTARVHYAIADPSAAEVTGYAMSDYCGQRPSTPPPPGGSSTTDPGSVDASDPAATCARLTAAAASILGEVAGPATLTILNDKPFRIFKCDLFLRRTGTVGGEAVRQSLRLIAADDPTADLCGPNPPRPFSGGCLHESGGTLTQFDIRNATLEFLHWGAGPDNVPDHLVEIIKRL